MKIQFDDKSYVEIVKSTSPNKVLLTVAVKDGKDSLTLLATTAEITIEQFSQLAKSVL
jgi:hypothetical protein